MAKKNHNPTPVDINQNTLSPAAVNLDLLQALANASPGTIPVSNDFFIPLHEAGYAESKGRDENGSIEVAITEKGKQHLQVVNPSPPINLEPAKLAAAVAEVKQAKEKTIFSRPIQFELPDAGKRGGARPELYPFDSLEVGKAFFIPATVRKPNPVTLYASTVASATRRYAEEIEGETEVNRRGRVVPKLRITREFKIRPVVDGAQFGDEFKGVSGAAIGRIA